MGGKDKSYLVRIPISRTIAKIQTVEKSSYAWKIQASFHGFDTGRYIKSILDELLPPERECRYRNDN